MISYLSASAPFSRTIETRDRDLTSYWYCYNQKQNDIALISKKQVGEF